MYHILYTLKVFIYMILVSNDIICVMKFSRLNIHYQCHVIGLYILLFNAKPPKLYIYTIVQTLLSS